MSVPKGWLRTVLTSVIFLFVTILSNVILNHQVFAGGPIMAAHSYVEGYDVIDKTTYGDPTRYRVSQKKYDRDTNNPNPRTLRIYKGQTVSFSFLLENWDPFPVPGKVNTEYRSMDSLGQDKLLSKDPPTIYTGLEDGTDPNNRPDGIPTEFWFTRRHTITFNGPGTDKPGYTYCAYVQTDPTVYDYLNPVNALTGGVTLGLHKFNSHDDAIVFPLGPAQSVKFPLGDVMSCVEIAYNYNLEPSITLGTPTGGTSVSATPAVTQTVPLENATYSQNTEWQISQFFLPSSANVGSTTSNRAPCTFFASTSGARNCITSAASAGTNTIFQPDGAVKSGSSFPSSVGFPDPNSIPTGYKVCYALSVNAYAPYIPTPAWRNSKVECLTETPKKPTLQIRGGDVRVGRYFNDASQGAQSGIYTSTTAVPATGVAGPSVMFGSWAEYGAFAPGPINNFASLSGFSGGHLTDPSAPSSSCPMVTNRLTFANNSPAGCGRLTQDMGQIPDIIGSLTARNSVSPPVGSSLRFDESSQPGLYKTTNTTGLSIDESVIGSGSGRTYIVYSPNQTVTINGNITIKDYDTKRYDKTSDIPQVIVIAKNININKDVSRIDAWLIAPGDRSDGVIDTCVGYASPFSSSACDKQLYINGPVMARQLNTWRTATYNGDCSITDDASRESCGESSDLPAETMNLPGSSLLWSLGGSNPSSLRTTYTTELPPHY